MSRGHTQRGDRSVRSRVRAQALWFYRTLLVLLSFLKHIKLLLPRYVREHKGKTFHFPKVRKAFGAEKLSVSLARPKKLTTQFMFILFQEGTYKNPNVQEKVTF